MNKLDLKKEYKYLYKPSAKQVEVVEVPEFNFVKVDGVVEAGGTVAESEEFHNAMMAVYGVAFTLKFMSKKRKENPIDYAVMALEGLWWVESGKFEFGKKEPWFYTAMIMQPEHITKEMYLQAVEEMKAKRDNPAIDKMRFERFQEGLSVQIMHIGPYSAEPPTIAKMDAFAEENGYLMRGKHHEIYLGDPRLAKPENLKTVLRHPVKKMG